MMVYLYIQFIVRGLYWLSVIYIVARSDKSLTPLDNDLKHVLQGCESSDLNLISDFFALVQNPIFRLLMH